MYNMAVSSSNMNTFYTVEVTGTTFTFRMLSSGTSIASVSFGPFTGLANSFTKMASNENYMVAIFAYYLVVFSYNSTSLTTVHNSNTIQALGQYDVVDIHSNGLYYLFSNTTNI